MLENHGIKVIVGPNASGKTSLLNKLYKKLAVPSTPISYIPQKAPLYTELTVQEIAVFYQKLTCYQFQYLFQLQTHANTLIKNLSAGFKQRLNLALGLSHPNEIIFIDEPIQNLDREAIYEVKQLLWQLKKQHTIILTAHQKNFFKDIIDFYYDIRDCSTYCN